MQIGKIYKQGGSQVLALPKSYLESLGWTKGTRVQIYLITQEGLLIKKSPPVQESPKSPAKQFAQARREGRV